MGQDAFMTRPRASMTVSARAVVADERQGYAGRPDVLGYDVATGRGRLYFLRSRWVWYLGLASEVS
jgi:hypothetical protein